MMALGHAMQTSGFGDRIGMEESPEIASRKILGLLLRLQGNHHVEFQPIVDLRTMQANEWECLFRLRCRWSRKRSAPWCERPSSPIAPSTSTRSSSTTLARIAEVLEPGPAGRRMRFGVNLLPTSLLAPSLRGERLRRPGADRRPVAPPDHRRVHRTAGHPRRTAAREARPGSRRSVSASPSTTPAQATRASPSSPHSSPRSSRSTARSSRGSATRTPRPRRRS